MRRQQHGLDLKEGGSRLGSRPNSLGECFLSLVSWSEGISIGAIATFPSRCEQRHYTANVQARSNAARSPRSSTVMSGAFVSGEVTPLPRARSMHSEDRRYTAFERFANALRTGTGISKNNVYVHIHIYEKYTYL